MVVANWVKSMHCKSSKMVQEVHNPIRKRLLPPIPASSSCRFSVQTIRQAIESTTSDPRPNPRKKPKPKSPCSPNFQKSSSAPQVAQSLTLRSLSTRTLTPEATLKELEQGHPSRNVVEIIFHTSWNPKAFPGRIDMVFKVQNPTRIVSRFEEYRESVRRRAKSSPHFRDGASRCVADGNEVLRFHCLGSTASSVDFDAANFNGGAFSGEKMKTAAVSTFSGSGAAHEKNGGGLGGRAMLVCRVIAGRVGKNRGGSDLAGFDSVGTDTGELVVLDSRAVLPCFLVIYRL